ncbi:unnamed protein product [Heligmosomoides polygyrus]|uniref:Vert_HS_TF domain-containing protein n=1 Tax=Heligmosomoides polygyrus TaxID=6339 RepID=A0A183FAI4_HELPZ|nr:unnamed protein product [Heligmosomoides polygyrus]
MRDITDMLSESERLLHDVGDTFSEPERLLSNVAGMSFELERPLRDIGDTSSDGLDTAWVEPRLNTDACSSTSRKGQMSRQTEGQTGKGLTSKEGTEGKWD